MAADEGTERDLADRLHEASLAAFDLASVYLGVRLGFYRALAAGPMSSSELASRANANARSVREWCE